MKRIPRGRRALSMGLVTLAVAAAQLPADLSAVASARSGHPTVAPYVDVSVSQTNLDRAVSSGHLRTITAAFVIGRDCTPIWDDGLPVSHDPHVSHLLAHARSRGVRLIVSFGGQAGSELASTCTGAKHLTAAYRAVLDKLKVHSVDFDIEGAAITDRASIARRFQAVRALQKARPHLTVSLTLPVLPSGLDGNGMAVLKAAHKAKVRIDLVNIMAMDYGTPQNMGRAAISAATHTRTQMRRVWPHAGYRNVGITAMIGHNDTPPEVFTLANARRVVAFATKHGLGRLAFWSLNRDRRCSKPQTAAQSTCSGVSEQPVGFTRIFVG